MYQVSDAFLRAVSSTNMREQVAEYYAISPDDGLTMNLGVNPFLQFGLKATRKKICEQILADDTVIRTKGDVKVNYLATPLFQYKNYLFGWGGSYGVDNRSAYLLTPYLASVNNLDEAVVKTTDKTMRITYTLTEE